MGWTVRLAAVLVSLALIGPVLIGPVLIGKADAAPGDALYALDNSTPLYAAPSPDAPVALRVNRGYRLIERARRDDWIAVEPYNVRLVDGAAWVRAAAVGSQQPAGTEPETAAPPEREPEFKPEPEDEDRFLLAVDGTPALAFKGRCRIVTADGKRRHRSFDGWAPKRFAIIAPFVSCHVHKHDARGRLRVVLSLDDTVIAVAETAGFFGGVRVRSDGPWGEADAHIDLPRLPLAHRAIPGPTTPGLPMPESMVPPFSASPVPPFTTSPVPPLMPAPEHDPIRLVQPDR